VEERMSDLCVWCQKPEPPDDYLELRPSKRKQFCSCEWNLDDDARESIVITLRARAERAEAELDKLLPLARFAAEILESDRPRTLSWDQHRAAERHGLVVDRYHFAPGVEETLAELRRKE